MINVNSPEQIQRSIAQLEENLIFVDISNFCEKEKADLRAIYRMQIRKYKEKQVSFYSESLTPNFVE
jgi:hypothetical protein